MPTDVENDEIHRLLLTSDELGVKLEITAGITTWEALPVLRHQRAVKRIMDSFTARSGTPCGCVEYSDVAIRFSDGSFKRPDIAIWCREPDEQDEAVTLIPEAVIEVISSGYEKKDTDIGAPFYLSAGVKDVILFNPQTGDVEHRRAEGTRKLMSPTTIALECGCVCTV